MANPPAAACKAAPAVGAKAPLRATAVAAVVILGTVMTVLDMTIVNVAMDHLSRTFDAPLSTVAWIATAYTLSLASVIPVTAWAVGRFGTKPLYLTALCFFVLGSALSGLAWDVHSLIAFRVLQGLGGGMLMPVGMTMVLRASDPAHKGRMMGLMGLPVLIGPIAGPVLGGWFVDAFTWRLIFFVNVPVGLLALLLSARVLRPDGPGSGRRVTTLDLPGLLMLSPGLALLIYGLSTGARRADFLAPQAQLPALLGAALIGCFVRRAFTTTQPLIDLRLLRHSALSRSVFVQFPVVSAYFGSMMLFQLYWQSARGLSPSEAGLLAIPQALVTGTCMQIASRLADRLPPRWIVLPGVSTAVAGFALFASQVGPQTPLWRLVGSLCLMGAGIGFTMMPNMTAATRSFSNADVPAATTTMNIVQQLSASVGTALMATLLTTTGSFPWTFGCGVALMSLAVLAATRLSGLRPVTEADPTASTATRQGAPHRLFTGAGRPGPSAGDGVSPRRPGAPRSAP
ncbi:DHA2 family efflux MFS transporter permease subunit [Streptomyces sp. NPDC006879]|uniref:DHA2 family efflux MFS transporter permease subunit n=1 Tax=Streptomyces sp. NPDC006879 TaxID=3364767 RepID=UPI0036A823CE